MRELFRQVSEPRTAAGNNRLSALPASIAVHVLVLLAIVVIPVLATDVLPVVVRGTDVSWMPTVMPPAPPPPAVPAARHAAAPIANPNAAPTVAPTGINRELRVVTDSQPDVAAPQVNGLVSGEELPPGFYTGIVSDAPPPRPATPVRVHTLLKPPVRIRDVSPIYPEAARLARIEGVVIIEAVIGPTGDVTDARVLRSKPLLDQAAVDAVRQWKYTPSLLNGIPVPVIMTVTVNFTLK